VLWLYSNNVPENNYLVMWYLLVANSLLYQVNCYDSKYQAR